MFSRNDQDFFVWGLDDSGKTTRFVRREWGLGWAYKAGNEGLKKIWEEELQDLYPSIHPSMDQLDSVYSGGATRK